MNFIGSAMICIACRHRGSPRLTNNIYLYPESAMACSREVETHLAMAVKVVADGVPDSLRGDGTVIVGPIAVEWSAEVSEVCPSRITSRNCPLGLSLWSLELT